jgi:hypothetical protein
MFSQKNCTLHNFPFAEAFEQCGEQSNLDLVWELRFKAFWFQLSNFLVALQATIVG